MKKIFFLFFIFVLFSNSYARNNLSIWAKITESKVNYIPWFTSTKKENGKNHFLDFRYNFDQPEAISAFYGKVYGNEKFSVTPAIGLIGKVVGLSKNWLAGEIYFSGEINKFNYFIMSEGGMSDSAPNFFYHWGDFTVKIFPWLKAGVGEEIYREPSFTVKNLGPSVRLEYKNIYCNIWMPYGLDNNSQTTFIGLGIIF